MLPSFGSGSGSGENEKPPFVPAPAAFATAKRPDQQHTAGGARRPTPAVCCWGRLPWLSSPSPSLSPVFVFACASAGASLGSHREPTAYIAAVRAAVPYRLHSCRLRVSPASCCRHTPALLPVVARYVIKRCVC